MPYMTGGAVSQQSQADKQADKIQEQAMKQAEQQKLRFNTKKADLMIENMVAQINDHYDRIIEGLKRAKTEKVQEAKGALMGMQADPEAGPQGTLPELPKPEVPFAPDAPEGMPAEMGMQGMPQEGMGMPPQGGPQGMPMEGMPMEGAGMPQEGMPPEMGMQGMEQEDDGSDRAAEELMQFAEQAKQAFRMSPEGEQMEQQVDATVEDILARLEVEGLTPEIQQEIQSFMEQVEMQQQLVLGGPPQGMPQEMPPDQGMPQAGAQPQWMPEEMPMANPYAGGPRG